MSNLVTNLAGVLVGGTITWFVAWIYYRQASRELSHEASELRRLNALMLHGMEYAGWIKLNRDASGKILGFEQVLKPIGIKSEVAFGTPEIKIERQ